jgi:hypothetical protein
MRKYQAYHESINTSATPTPNPEHTGAGFKHGT